jgi:hypothetical protein
MWRRLLELADFVARQRHPYIKSAVLVLLYGVVFVTNSLVRVPDLYPAERSANYVAHLYVGGVFALAVANLVVALVFFLLFRSTLQTTFGALYLGLIVFGFVDAATSLLNLLVPVLVYTRVAKTVVTYTVLSVPHFLELDGQPPFVWMALSLLDVVFLLGIYLKSVYVARVTRRAVPLVFFLFVSFQLLVGAISP